MSMYPGEPKRRGLALTIVGGVGMFLVAPAMFIIGTVIGVSGAVDLVNQAPLVQPGGTVAMEQGQTRDIYAYLGPSSSDTGIDSGSTTFDRPECTVQGPGGDVALRAATDGTTWTRDGSRFVSVGSFTASQAGEHTVTCAGGPALVPDGKQASEAGKKIGWGVGGGLVGATLIGLIGLIMLIVGIVKLVNSNKERSQYRYQQQAAQWGQAPRW